MTRDKAYKILTEFIKNPNLIKHHLAAEAAMRGLGEYFQQNEPNIDVDKWRLVGLLHDADYEETKLEPKKHTLILEQKLGKELPADVIHAIKAHAFGYNDNGVQPKSKMDWSIFCCDELTGLIIAAALVKPDRKLASVDVQTVLNRMKEVSFARSVNRDQIKMCEEKLEIPLEKFIEIVLQSMKSISNDLGL